MKNLPLDNQRNSMQHANVHCAYCNDGYEQMSFPGMELQIHNSWIFFPWHRFYLYFNEFILRELLGDHTFTLPFWNWDSLAGMQMSNIYTNASSSLYDPLCDQTHQPSTIISLNFNNDTKTVKSSHMLRKDNLYIMHLAFMGNFCSATNDPIFFAHRSNIDRLWNVWKTLGSKREDFTDNELLNTGFHFHDENELLLRVKVNDSLDTERLHYRYQKVDNPSVSMGQKRKNFKNKGGKVDNLIVNKKTKRAGTERALILGVESTFPVNLTKMNVNVVVKMPARMERKEDVVEDVVVVLTLEGLEFDKTVYTKFDVYANASVDTILREVVEECAGSFIQVPCISQPGKENTDKIQQMNVVITDFVDDTMTADNDEVLVTLVPRCGTVKIERIYIELHYNLPSGVDDKFQ